MEQFDTDNGVTYPTVSDDGGGTNVCSIYGVTAYPTMVLIAPDRTIVEQDLWPINTSNINTVIQSYGCSLNACYFGIQADFLGTPTTIAISNSVDFTDLTYDGTPISWNWSFPGGTPSTSTDQNPQNIIYYTAGTYDVTLEVSDGTDTDIETKVGYITVTPPTTLWADFSASATTIIEGQTIDFYDQSYNGPTSWTWTFNGAVTTSSTDQNPVGIQYNVPGTYDVTLEVSDGTNTHSTTKTAYITVIDSSYLPVVNFTSDFTTVFVGGSVNYFDLSTNSPYQWEWTFEGGIPANSTDQNPTVITYNNVGTYDVTLKATNLIGTDSLYIDDYITVIDNSSLGPLTADFQATGSRLIQEGGSVSFHDLTIGYPTSWEWSFPGGTPATSNIQHPMNITYNTPGYYDVQLIVSNGNYSDTLVKQNFIIVTHENWQDPNGFCDTVSNIKSDEIMLGFRKLSSTWGYFPGHNGYNIRAYADKFVNYTFSHVRGLLIPVVKAYSSTTTGKVRVTLWDVDTTGFPGNELAHKDVLISSFSPYIYHAVLFDAPVNVNGKFFAGFQLYYTSPQDTFVVYMSPDRGLNGDNTLYVKKGTWKYPHEVLGDSINTSLAIDLIGCLVFDEEIINDTEILIYPQPGYDYVNVQLKGNSNKIDNLFLYDMLGKKYNPTFIKNKDDEWKINVENINAGMYILQIISGNQNICRRIIIM